LTKVLSLNWREEKGGVKCAKNTRKTAAIVQTNTVNYCTIIEIDR